jgi:hypothetical protein
MNSLFNEPQQVFDELPARSPLPWVWFGFIFAFTFLVGELLEVFLELDPEKFQLALILISLAGWIYWLFCVYRFHTILAEISQNQYPIIGSEAVGKHFIPLYNLWWLFKWPGTLSTYINSRGRVRMIPGSVLGILLLVAVILRYVDSAIAMTLLFAVGMYMSAKLQRHIAIIKGLSPEMLPPPPDASMFEASATGTEPAERY